ncbi:MAG TPA: hypothetical protein VFP05_10035 [Thermomicrobiales bacterium]|nr:hypothetical protein [Thermomicrobiales bacterium]
MDDARPVIYLTFNEEESIPWDANIPFPTLESRGAIDDAGDGGDGDGE